MNISTTSWHYKVVKLVSGWYGPPTNLCPYIRRLLLGIVFVTVVGALALVFGALLLASGIGAVLHFIDVFIYDLSWFPSIDPTDKNSGFQLILLGYIIDIAAITAGVWIGTEERRRIWTNRRRAKRAAAENVEPVYKEPSVVGQWLKDRHDKVCRQLSFTTPNATNDYT